MTALITYRNTPLWIILAKCGSKDCDSLVRINKKDANHAELESRGRTSGFFSQMAV